MAVPTSMNFRFKFPEFSGVDDTVIEMALEEATILCGRWNAGDSSGWTDDANETLGIVYSAAHILQMSILQAASGTGQIISSERIGELSMTYAVPDKDQTNDFKMTRYGRKFLELVKSNFPAVLTVGSAIRP